MHSAGLRSAAPTLTSRMPASFTSCCRRKTSWASSSFDLGRRTMALASVRSHRHAVPNHETGHHYLLAAMECEWSRSLALERLPPGATGAEGYVALKASMRGAPCGEAPGLAIWRAFAVDAEDGRTIPALHERKQGCDQAAACGGAASTETATHLPGRDNGTTCSRAGEAD